jgi:hypothetical protein
MSVFKNIVYIPNPVVWPLSFSGFEVIVNREMPHYQNLGVSSLVYNLLVSLGQDHQVILDLLDLGAQLGHPSRTMVYIAGKVLEHGVPRWGDGERIMIAHFVKDNVYDKQGIPKLGLPMKQNFLIQVGAGRGQKPVMKVRMNGGGEGSCPGG